MSNLEKKRFLDEAGLRAYDELIKAYIDNGNKADQDSVDEVIASLAALSATVTADEARIQANTDAIAVLNGDASTEGSVAKAIADLVGGAPETLDTLKELADWIASDETASAQLVNRVGAVEDAIDELKAADVSMKAYVDAQDEAVYNSIQSLETLKINALFPEVQKADESAAVAIATLEAGKALKLTANQSIADNLTINKACYIDANGSTFTGIVTIPANADVVIENATFANPVVVA